MHALNFIYTLHLEFTIFIKFIIVINIYVKSLIQSQTHSYTFCSKQL